ncbi:DinB family protein [Actinophytocola sediminis]
MTRTEPPTTGGERDQLTGFLDYLRATVVLKAGGLTDDQARRPLLESSPLTTVAGVVAHLVYVEQAWFCRTLDGQPDEWAARFAVDPDAEFRVGHEIALTEVIARYERQCAISREIAAAMALSDEGTHRTGQVNLRWVLIHMIEETARHAGHLDLLRESLDGSTGE